MKRLSTCLLTPLILVAACKADTSDDNSTSQDTADTETALDSAEEDTEDDTEVPDCDTDTEAPDCDTDTEAPDCDTDTEAPDCDTDTDTDTDTDSGSTPPQSTTVVSPATSLPTALPSSGSKGSLTSISNAAPAGQIEDVNFAIDLNHTCTKDLSATLTAPSGTAVELFNLNGLPVCSSDLRNTLLDDEAARQITQGKSPFTGKHRPTGMLSDFDGEDAQGVWTLEILDNTIGDSGKLNSWSLELTLK